MTLLTVDIGDVLAVRTGGLFGKLIRFGAALTDSPNLDNHIAVVHHRDASGTLWVVEGWPGGVAYRNASDYLSSTWTVSNAGQTKTAAQRGAISKICTGLIGTPYDWEGIIQDAMVAIGAQEKWNFTGQGAIPGKAPAQLVCSSLAAYVYESVGLLRPTRHTIRDTTPSDWEQFIIDNRWK